MRGKFWTLLENTFSQATYLPYGMRTIDRDVLQDAVISLYGFLMSHRLRVFLGRWPSHEPLAMFKMDAVTSELTCGYGSLYRLPDVAKPRLQNKQKWSK